MSEKNRLSIDGGQIKEDEHVSSYKPLPDADTEFRSSKANLSKSKEKVSADGAEEKLLRKEDEAKIIRVDMADAKYVVGDHRNGDAKIELDANKRQFSGLSKEELLKYADDPFWVNLRWALFILFWAAWLAMLAGAIAIIIQAPKCYPPAPRTWYELGPLVDAHEASYEEVVEKFDVMKETGVRGVIVDVPTYKGLDSPDLVQQFKNFVVKAKDAGIKVIADLIPNSLSVDHPWFKMSENSTAPFTDYFIWSPSNVYNDSTIPNPPNNWLSNQSTSAWTRSDIRKEFYLHMFGEGQADLNFQNQDVISKMDQVLRVWLDAGASGIRLNNFRRLLVNPTFPAEEDHWTRRHTTDQPGLANLLQRWAAITDKNPPQGESVLMVSKPASLSEEVLTSPNISSVQFWAEVPVSLEMRGSADKAIEDKLKSVNHTRWTALELKSDGGNDELALFAMLLPATPVIDMGHLVKADNDTPDAETPSHLAALRADATLSHGKWDIAAVPSVNGTGGSLIACARWKVGHTGFVSVYNPWDEATRANLTEMSSLPTHLTVSHVSKPVNQYTNYTSNFGVQIDDILVPPKSSVVLSYVPKTTAEK